MDTRTTLDFKTAIADWKLYQQNKRKRKLKMAGRNTFRCQFSFGADIISEGILSYCYVDVPYREPYLQVISVNGIVSAVIYLNHIRGANQDGTTIQLTLQGQNQQFLMLTFNSVEERVLAFTAFEDLQRKPIRQPTPPSSGSSNEDI